MPVNPLDIGTARYKIIRVLCEYELILSSSFDIQLERPTGVNLMMPLAAAPGKRVVLLKSYYRRRAPSVTRKLPKTIGLLVVYN